MQVIKNVNQFSKIAAAWWLGRLDTAYIVGNNDCIIMNDLFWQSLPCGARILHYDNNMQMN